jgi:hypothetical protein
MVRARLSPQSGSISSAKAVSASVQARCLLTGAGAGWGWGADRPMSSAMSPPAGAPGWHTMCTHTSCCGAAAAVGPGTAGPGFLPRPSAGPLAAWRRQQRQRRPVRAACAPAVWPPRRARPQPKRPPAVAAFWPPASHRSRRGSGARAAGRARQFPAVSECFFGPELEFTGTK